MKIDKNQSMKNRIGVFLSSALFLSLFLLEPAIAKENSYIKIDYLYDEDHRGIYR